MARPFKNNNQGHSANGDESPTRFLKKDDILAATFGAVQPQAPEMEAAVLGATLVDSSIFVHIRQLLKYQDFYTDANQHVFRAMSTLYNANKPIDLLTVVEELRKEKLLDKIGGVGYIIELSNRVASTANTEYHASIVKQQSLRREAITACLEGARKLFDDGCDVFETRRKMVETLDAPPAELIFDVMSPEEAVYKGLSEPPSSRLFGDFLRIGQLGIMFAPPGTGKSAAAYQMADAAARGTSFLPTMPNEHGKPMKTLVIDFENDKSDLADRYADSVAGTAHKWAENMTLLLLKSDSLIVDDFESKAMHQIEYTIEQTKPSFIVLDNLTYLTAETVSDATIGMRLMKKLLYYQKSSGATLLVLAHSTKRYNKTKPLESGDYQGSAAILQFTQTMWGMNRSATDDTIVYFKQFKQRKGGVVFGEENVVCTQLGKTFEHDPVTDFLRFRFVELSNEAKHLASFVDHDEQDAIVESAIRLKIANPGDGISKIAKEVQWAQTTESLRTKMKQYASKSRQYELLDGGHFRVAPDGFEDIAGAAAPRAAGEKVPF